jgi:hypothetical protein
MKPRPERRLPNKRIKSLNKPAKKLNKLKIKLKLKELKEQKVVKDKDKDKKPNQQSELTKFYKYIMIYLCII